MRRQMADERREQQYAEHHLDDARTKHYEKYLDVKVRGELVGLSRAKRWDWIEEEDL